MSTTETGVEKEIHPLKNKTSPPHKTSSSITRFIPWIIVFGLLVLAIPILVRYFLIQPFYVDGAAMEPNFFDHEYLIIDEFSYRFSEPERGDILVFRYPNDPKNYFIKRLIGLPGETVEVADGQVKIYNDVYPDGIILDESLYLSDSHTVQTRRETLKANEYFVLGDNRNASLDSRFFGPINEDAIVGRVWIRVLPLDSWKVFKPLEYQL